jgi:hypothetical protein
MIEWAVAVWALGYETEGPVKVLAVVGAGAVGALGVGGLVQVFVKLAFAQQVPRWPMWGIRGLGGVASAWLVYLWLFGSGSGGLGRPGGWFGGGRGDGADKSAKVEPRAKDKESKKEEEKDKDKDKGKGEAPPEQTLKVEVLGNDTLKKLAGSGSADLDKRYRIPGEARLYTLEEVRKLVKDRRQGTPPLKRLVVIVYNDSPDRNRPQVADLVDWARDLDPERGKVEVDLQEPDRKAPVD